MKILLIDDDIQVLTSLTKFLERMGFECVPKDNPIEALQSFKKESFDTVITDFKMPELNGNELLEKIKQIDSKAYVIVITGYAELDNAIESLNLGAYAYLKKPIDLGQLLIVLRGINSEQKTAKIRAEEKAELAKKLLIAQKFEATGKISSTIAENLKKMLQPLYKNIENSKYELPQNHFINSNYDHISSSFKSIIYAIDQIIDIRSITEAPENIRIGLLIQEIVKMLIASTPETILFEHEIPADCGIVKGHSEEIKQIILNLYSNSMQALEAADDKIFTIKLRKRYVIEGLKFQHEVKPGLYAQLTIEDSGCGIPEKDLQLIFEPFNDLSNNSENLGLGLYIVKQNLDKMNGHIFIESKVDKGTLVTVYFPREE